MLFVYFIIKVKLIFCDFCLNYFVIFYTRHTCTYNVYLLNKITYELFVVHIRPTVHRTIQRQAATTLRNLRLHNAAILLLEY